MSHELPPGFPFPAPADPPDLIAGLMRAADDWRRGQQAKAAADVEAMADRLGESSPNHRLRAEELQRLSRSLQLLLAARGVGLGPESVELSSRDLESVHVPDLAPAPLAGRRAFAPFPVPNVNLKTTLRSESLQLPKTDRLDVPLESPRPIRERRTTLREGTPASTTFVGTPVPFARVLDRAPPSEPARVTVATNLPLKRPFDALPLASPPPPDSMPTMPMTLVEGEMRYVSPPSTTQDAPTAEPEAAAASSVPETPRSIAAALPYLGLAGEPPETATPTVKVDPAELAEKLKR